MSKHFGEDNFGALAPAVEHRMEMRGSILVLLPTRDVEGWIFIDRPQAVSKFVDE